MTIFEEVVIVLHKLSAAVLDDVKANLLALVEVGLVAFGLTPARASQISLGEKGFGAPAGGTSDSSRSLGKFCGGILEVADDELKHVLLIVARTHGIVDNLLIMFEENDGTPQMHGIIVGAGSHQTSLTDTGFFGPHGYFRQTLGVEIVNSGIGHSDDREESLPSTAEVFVQRIDGKQGKLRPVIGRIGIIGTQTAEQVYRTRVIVKPRTVVERSGRSRHSRIGGIEVVFHIASVGHLVKEVTCGSSEAEISACAADMTDWLRFVKDAGQFPYEKAEALHLLTEMVLGSGQETFHFSLRSPEVYMGDIPWDERYHRMKKAIEERFDAYYVWLGERREQEVQWQEESEEDDSSFMDIYNGGYEKECLVGDGTVRYRMVVEDAALGSRFYGLLKSMDGGQTWQMSNPDPFDQQTGMGIDFIFLDESFGFASLMYNGGDEAVLYVTKDGGDSYRPVVIEGYTVTLENGDTYDPYDYPRMPYEEDGRLFLQCGQGADGDYAGGDTAGLALYESMDGGDTFVFREIRENSKTG